MSLVVSTACSHPRIPQTLFPIYYPVSPAEFSSPGVGDTRPILPHHRALLLPEVISGEKLNIAEDSHQDNSILFGPFGIALPPTDRVTWDSAPIYWTLPCVFNSLCVPQPLLTYTGLGFWLRPGPREPLKELPRGRGSRESLDPGFSASSATWHLCGLMPLSLWLFIRMIEELI